MTKTVKKSKTAKTATKKADTKNATVAPKLRTKYGAPSVRPNRADKTAKSELGNRKYIYKGVTVAKGDNFEAVDATECTAFPKERAERILANALKREDVINARLFYKKSQDETPMRSVWLAFTKDNGTVKATA